MATYQGGDVVKVVDSLSAYNGVQATVVGVLPLIGGTQYYSLRSTLPHFAEFTATESQLSTVSLVTPRELSTSVSVGANLLTAPQNITSTSSNQLTVGYDGSNKFTVSVSNSGAVIFDASGSGASFYFNDKLTATNFKCDNSENVFAGVGCGNTTLTGTGWNSGLGNGAGGSLTTGYGNSLYGRLAGRLLTSGYENSIFGANAGLSLVDGYSNVLFGSSAGSALTTGHENVIVGTGAGSVMTTGLRNTIVGDLAGIHITTGYSNVFLGRGAGLAVVDGTYNTLAGHGAGAGVTSGNFNCIFGDSSASALTTGSYNTIFGSDTGMGIITGSYNTIIRAQVAGLSSSLSNTVILADGQGNQRLMIDSFGNTIFSGDLRTLGAMRSDGTLIVFGNLGVGGPSSSSARAKLYASTIALSQINLPVGVAPTSPSDGDIWMEANTSTGLKIRINGATLSFSLTS